MELLKLFPQDGYLVIGIDWMIIQDQHLTKISLKYTRKKVRS